MKNLTSASRRVFFFAANFIYLGEKAKYLVLFCFVKCLTTVIVFILLISSKHEI